MITRTKQFKSTKMCLKIRELCQGGKFTNSPDIKLVPAPKKIKMRAKENYANVDELFPLHLWDQANNGIFIQADFVHL